MIRNTPILACAIKHLFLLFPMIIIGLEANALTCDRYRLDTSGFSNKAAAESYYPKILELDDSLFEPKGGNSKQMRFDTAATESRTGNTQRFIFSLLPNGKLSAALQGRSGYKQPGKAKYKCNLNAVELREKLENQASTGSTVNNNTCEAGMYPDPTGICFDPCGLIPDLLEIMQDNARLAGEPIPICTKNQSKVEQSGKMSLSDAKNECAAIGYTSGTEKFADCVMQLTK